MKEQSKLKGMLFFLVRRKSVDSTHIFINLPQSFSVILRSSALYLRISVLRLPSVSVIPRRLTLVYYRSDFLIIHIDGLVLERCNRTANALGLRLFCTNPSVSFGHLTYASDAKVTWCRTKLRFYYSPVVSFELTYLYEYYIRLFT